MSDQHTTDKGVVLDLEGIFLSREFGRRPVRVVSTAPATVASEPAQLEQVFLSDVFGHPEVVDAAVRVEEPALAPTGQPILVLLRGGGEGTARDTTHYRAIAAVSGVAAAALAVAGLSSGTGHGPGRAPLTEQAQGAPNQAQTGSGGGSQRGAEGSTVLPNPSNTGTAVASGSGGSNATLTSFTTPVAVPSPQGATGGGSAVPPAAFGPGGGGSSPGAPSGSGGSGGSGGGSTLAPALSVVGNEVSSVGSSVSSTTGDVGQALPVASVLQAVGSVATSAVNNLGGGTPPTILGALKQ